MASNAASSRRSFLRRPKVCLTPSNPGRCHPPPDVELPPRTCLVTQLQEGSEPGDNGEYFLMCCCEALPELQIVDVVMHLSGGWIEQIGTMGNCPEEETSGGFVNPDEEGEHTITATFTWSDSGTCISTCTITVEEENGDDD